MKTFWNLYRKEFRALTWPGFGMILYMNAGWLVLFLKYVSYTSYYRFWDYVFPPHRLGRYSPIVMPLALVFLYALVYEHISQKRHQGLLFPVRRSVPVFAKFCAAMTWAYASIPVTILLHTVHKAFGYPHSLFWSNSIDSAFSYVGAFAYMAVQMLISCMAICSLIMLGYAVAISVRRLYVLVGAATVVVGFISSSYLRLTIANRLLLYLGFENNFRIVFQFGLPMLTAALFLIPALFLYERYAEI